MENQLKPFFFCGTSPIDMEVSTIDFLLPALSGDSGVDVWKEGSVLQMRSGSNQLYCMGLMANLYYTNINGYESTSPTISPQQ